MGTWGTAIFSNDLAFDIKDEFLDAYNDGLAVDQIRDNILKDFNSFSDTPASSDFCNAWFALASCLWDVGALDAAILKRVKKLFKDGTDAKAWIDSGGSPRDITKRQKVVKEFINKITTPKTKARPRKKKIIYEPDYQVGDCLVVSLFSGKYAGFIVFEARASDRLATNKLFLTDIYSDLLPTIADFKKAKLLTFVPTPNVEDQSFLYKTFWKTWSLFSEKTTLKYTKDLKHKDRLQQIGNLTLTNIPHWSYPFKNGEGLQGRDFALTHDVYIEALEKTVQNKAYFKPIELQKCLGVR